MIELIGTKNCAACKAVSNLFDQHGVQYEHLLFEHLSQERQTDIKVLNIRSFPIIIQDGEVVEVSDVL